MSENAKNHRLEDILLYEQNLLEDDERRELEEHMAGCAECQASLLTAKKFLPMLHEALKPDEPSAEELLARAMAQLAEKAAAQATKQRARVLMFRRAAFVGAGLAAAAAAFFVLRPVGPAMVAQGEVDAGAQGGMMTSPHPQSSADSGVDGGVGTGGAGK